MDGLQATQNQMIVLNPVWHYYLFTVPFGPFTDTITVYIFRFIAPIFSFFWFPFSLSCHLRVIFQTPLYPVFMLQVYVLLLSPCYPRNFNLHTNYQSWTLTIILATLAGPGPPYALSLTSLLPVHVLILLLVQFHHFSSVCVFYTVRIYLDLSTHWPSLWPLFSLATLLPVWDHTPPEVHPESPARRVY